MPRQGASSSSASAKARHDLATVIAERLPGARIETSPGRVVVETDDAGALDTLLISTGSCATCAECAPTRGSQLESNCFDA